MTEPEPTAIGCSIVVSSIFVALLAVAIRLLVGG